MSQSAIADLENQDLGNIYAKAVDNVLDVFIMLALRRKRLKPQGYGGMTARDISEVLNAVGIKVTAREVRRRYDAWQKGRHPSKFFGEKPAEKEVDDVGRKLEPKLKITAPANIAQADFLARALAAISDRRRRMPSFLYRRKNWKIVAEWSIGGFCTRHATEGEIDADDVFRSNVDENRSSRHQT